MVAQGLGGLIVPVRGQVVEYDNGSGGDLGDQHFADVGSEGGAIHCALDDPWCDQCIWCQARDQRLRAPATKGCIHCQAFTPLPPAAQTGQIGLHCRFVNEDNAFRQGRNGRQPMSEPIGALLPYLGATALGGDQRLFCT